MVGKYKRYVRLTELIKPLLQLVDENKMAMNPAVEISYLKRTGTKGLIRNNRKRRLHTPHIHKQ